MTTSKGSFFISAIALLVFSANLAFALNYELSPSTIAPGERATVKVRLDASLIAGEEELPLINDKLITNNQSFTVLEQRLDKEGDFWVWRYDVTAYNNGEFTVPPVELTVAGETYSTESVKVTVSGSRGEGDVEIRPEYDALKRPFPWKSLFRVMAWLCFVGLISSILLFVNKNLPQWRRRIRTASQKPVVVPVVPEEDPKLWLRRELNRLRASLENNRGSTIDDFTNVVREFYSRTHKLPARAYTSAELRVRLPDEKSIQAIAPVFDECDIYKFAPLNKADELSLAIKAIDESERVLLC